MKHALHIFIIVFIAAVIVGCSSAPTKPEKPEAGGWVGYTEKGKASFYADKHQNQKTANGERYDHNLNTAAHRTIPFGSQLKVTNVENGKSVVATVNDRGPYARGRIVDLSKSAFDSIASTSTGVIDVQIEVIE
jgi:rare lipoprotein A